FNYEGYEPVPTLAATQPLFWPLPVRVWPLAPVFASSPIPADPRLWFTPLLARILGVELLCGALVLFAAWRLPARERAGAPAGVGAES
ncbi:MAG: hypothetical protein HY925_12145, partial [Elusimicrobia bacterium]|nr:hypothetical protein [Elusimicrobiota bacterium]